ncbi:MAG: endonuclease/exonuclease/phosphatase family protein [Alphaproteobacteria bacterium]|nr:MAG: endonuclease/exonuclease/phosphatase family protein [Alphaproteobacteria bacterium]
MSQLRIASINIERSKHLRLVEKFLHWYSPDVLCLQELCQRDIPMFEELLGNKLHYVPMCYHPAEEDPEPIGLGIVAWSALTDVTVDYYHGQPQPLQHIRFITEADGYTKADNDSVANMLLSATCQGFRIGTTHLNVTRQGESTPEQRTMAQKLVTAAQAQAQRAGGLLMCGDFNAPRGRETFSLIAKHFEDGIPPEFTTSIDGSLHKAGQLPHMVDGLFHTPSYKLTQATLHTGVSDHCALTCTLSSNK